MKPVLISLSACGFVVSAAAHIAALSGVVLGGEGLLFAYFSGAILLFFPTVFTMAQKYPKLGPRFTWADVLAHCPAPIRALFYVTFFYAFGSFLFLWAQGTEMKHRSGEPLAATTARGFSGHAMAFYMASIAIMLSVHRGERKNA